MSGLQIDEWLPEYTVRASYSIRVLASPEQTFAALKSANFGNLTIVRQLMRLRGYGPKKESKESNLPLPGSFLPLAAIEPKEVVLGIVGKFWRPDGGIVRGLTPEEFRDFQAEGYAKAVWNFSLAPSRDGTCLTTETRVLTRGRSATFKFRLYWLVVGPFSGLMRRAMLREVKRIAEQPSVDHVEQDLARTEFPPR